MVKVLLLSVSSWFSEFGRSFCDSFVDEIKVGNIGEDINEGIMQWKQSFRLGGVKLMLTDAIIVTWIAVFIAAVIFGLMARKATIRPDGKQNVLEALVGLIISVGMSFGMTRKEAEHVMPMIGTMGIMIMSCNVISAFKVAPPAKNIAFPVAMALFAIIYVIYASIRFVGVKGFWASLTSPLPYLLPFKVLDYLIKPVSLALRLFGNVFGAFVFMEFLYIVIPFVVPGLFGLWFDIADGILQAVVFSYLTMSYIGEAVEVGHEYWEHPEEFQRKKKDKKKDSDAAAVAA